MIASFINPHDICFMAIMDGAAGEESDTIAGYMAKVAKTETATCRWAEQLPEGMAEETFYSTACPPLPDNYQPAADEPEAIAILQQERLFKKLARENYTDERWRLHRWAYKRLTEKVDAEIGTVLDAVRAAGLWEDTVIIFTSDHGDMDASHKMEHKECLYEECCRVPLIIKGVGGGAPQTENALVSNGLDLYPTLLDYAGTDIPAYLEGFSLKGRVQGGMPLPKRTSLVVECENGIMAVDGQHKYCRYDRGVRSEQFYDLAVNPGEMYNQIGDTQYAVPLHALRQAVDSHLAEQPRRFGVH